MKIVDLKKPMTGYVLYKSVSGVNYKVAWYNGTYSFVNCHEVEKKKFTRNKKQYRRYKLIAMPLPEQYISLHKLEKFK